MRKKRCLILIVLCIVFSPILKIKAEDVTLPKTPTNINITANDNKIVLSWNIVENAIEYEVEVDGIVINNSYLTVFEHEHLLPLTTHQYKVRAVNKKGKSEWSSLIQQKTANPKLQEINVIKTNKEIIQPRYGFGAVEVNNEIYIIGGYGNGYVNTIEKYNSIENTWEIKTNLPTMRTQANVVAHNNKIYIIGGYNNNDKELGTVDVYDIEKDKWMQTKPMPTKRRGMATVEYNNKIYVFGGYNEAEKSLDTVEVYDIENDLWKIMQQMPTKRSLMGAVLYHDKIYVMGGYNGFVLGDIEVYDILSDTWETKGQMPVPRHSFNAMQCNDKIMIIGGYNTVPFNTIELYNPKDNKFIFQNSLNKSRYSMGAVIMQDELYVIGGTNEASPMNIVEKAYIKKDEAPTNFNLEDRDNEIRLTWDKIDSKTFYEVEVNGDRLNNGLSNTFLKKDIKVNKKYYFRVRAITDKGISKWSSFKTYIKYSSKPCAYAYIGDRNNDKDNYETISLYIMTKNINDIYAAEIEGSFDIEDLIIEDNNIEQLLFPSEKQSYQYIDLDKKKGRIYINLSLEGDQHQNNELVNMYKILLKMKTLDTTKIIIKKINLVDSIGHRIDITDVYDLDIPSLY